MNTRFFVLAAAVLTVNGVELSASPQEAEQTLKALDLDGSGTVTQEEVQKFAESQGLKVEDVKSEFMQLDKDGDGQLSTEEVMAMASDESEKKEDKPETNTAAEKEADTDTDTEVEVAPAKAEGVKQDLSAQMKEATADAEKAAGASMAQKFAKLAALAMAHKAKNEAEAARHDATSKKLLEEAKELTKGAAAKAQTAAKDAADKVVQAAMTQLQDLERQAAAAEESAKNYRKQQHEAMTKVKKSQKLMGEME